MNQDLQNYLKYKDTPWGLLFYKMVWKQLGDMIGLKILDFGSGFGVTANHYAKDNTVTAVEPNKEMVENRISEHPYKQLNGSIEELKNMATDTFDAIICHNVFEYVEDKERILCEFKRLIKKDGLISIVKHNHSGRIMSKVVFENSIEEAIGLLEGADSQAINFGKINYYDINHVVEKLDGLQVIKTLGVRTFCGLQQNNDAKYENDWSDKMLQVEIKVSDLEVFKNIAFFHHIILKRK